MTLMVCPGCLHVVATLINASLDVVLAGHRTVAFSRR
jgi:hypothetical protein